MAKDRWLTVAQLGAEARTHEERLKCIASELADQADALNAPIIKKAAEIQKEVLALRQIRFELENRVNHLEVEIERLEQK